MASAAVERLLSMAGCRPTALPAVSGSVQPLDRLREGVGDMCAVRPIMAALGLSGWCRFMCFPGLEALVPLAGACVSLVWFSWGLLRLQE